MDCDDVIVLFADSRTLSPAQTVELDDHLAGCEECSELARHRTGDAGLPLHALGQRLLELPTVDPKLFEGGRVVATGGMGKITRAFDRRLGREVAIKEMLSTEQRARFEREAAITARLQHPAIVPVYEAGQWPDGSVFYTMRLVPGGTLGESLAGRSSLTSRLELLPHVIAATEALAYAHAHGVIHRDLKPHNILVGEFGETVVIDWGLAKQLGDPEGHTATAGLALPDLTMAGAVVGTPCYMSPEQARGADLDERADVFALGAILYNVLAGAAPYWDQTHDSKRLLDAVMSRPPTPLDELVPDAPADLRAIVDRAMTRDLAARFPNAGAMAEELRRFQAGQLLVSREYTLRDLVARWIARHRAAVRIAAVAAVALVAVAAVALVIVMRAHAARDTAFERGQRKLCESETPRLASPWDASARELVHRKFESTKLPYVAATLARVDASFERWSAELAAARDTVCPSAAGEPPPRALLAAELDCLADRTREARALIALFHEADAATVLNAVASTEQLAPITRCTTTAVPRAVPAASPALADVRDLFARSHALMELGKARDALPLAKRAVAGADAIGDPGLRGAALVALGAAQIGTSDLDAAQATLQVALRLADASQDDRTRAQAWSNLVRIEYWRGHYDQVVFMQAAALGAAERIGDVWLQTEIMLNVGGALSQKGKLAEAQGLFEQAVALRKKIYGERDHRLAYAQSALGNAYAMQGKLDAGIAAHRNAVITAEAALGATHPGVGVLRGNLGDDYIYALRAPEAVAELESDLAVLEAADGPRHRDVAMALTDLGMARLEAGQLAPAEATFDRAETLWRDLNAKHPARAEALLGRYLARQGLGKPVDVADLETALPLGAGLPPFERARIQLALGVASSGPKAIELVKAAAAGFATSTLPLCQRELAVAKAWLAAHPH